MQEDVEAFFAVFHDHTFLDRGTNKTFIALIPKIEGASCFNHFRLISMVGWLYKILA